MKLKSKLKIFISLILCFSMVFSLAACSKPAEQSEGPDKTEAIYKAGTYTAVGQGNNGDVKVEVVFDDTSIVSIEVLEHNETAGLSDAPIDRIPTEIVEGQTLAVDTVSGATNTSKAILEAVEDCVIQAGGNVDDLKAALGNSNGEGKVTELTTDVVVVGAGGTGLAAAASAYENGADVIVLEKLANVGGSTGLSGGGIGATGTKFQVELGIEDTKESWMELWKERQATSNPDSKYPDYSIVDKFMDDAVVTTEWLADYVGHEYGSIAGYGVDPVERLHFPKEVEGKKGGMALIHNINKFVEDKGIQVLTETPATELITDENGDVIGVVAKGKDGKIIINAKKVILAAGGFAKSEEMLERLVPELKGSSELSAASAGSTGDGILMAEKLGAALYEDQWVIGLATKSKVAGTGALTWDWSKVYVNKDGERFTNEQIHYAILTNKFVEEDFGWLVMDSAETNATTIESLETSLSTGEVVKGDTLEALAEEMGVPSENLVSTMAAYNDGVKSGKDAMGKDTQFLVSVEKAPYYAIKFYPQTMGTFGGVKTNENYQVVKEDGTVINNLYAGGENANRMIYNQVYMSGSAVQFALTSGRLAGAHAAQNLK